MEFSRFAIIGLGIIGQAIMPVLISYGVEQQRIALREKDSVRLNELMANGDFGQFDLELADVVILCVKPQDLESVMNQIVHQLREGCLVISILAGVNTSKLEKLLGPNVRVVRVMTNTPIALKLGASAIVGGSSALQSDVTLAQAIFSHSGKSIIVDEEKFDAVTATSGSGPAYFFRFVEAMIAGAVELGLTEVDAHTLVVQTISGAAAMLAVEGASPATLRANVTSPNGTTYAALQSFEASDLEGIIKRAMTAARDRSRELS
jgi:pyrroline-5-carboxylate reductase